MNSITQYLAAHPIVQFIGVPVLIFVGFWLFESILRCCIIPLLLRAKKRAGSKADDQIILAALKPLKFLILILGLYAALVYLPLTSNADLILSHLFRSLLIVVVAWGFIAVAGAESVLSNSIKERYKLDLVLMTFFSRVIKFVIIALAIVLLANEWDYDVNGFIAGLGLGGLAFALAAKDALANIFGGIVIIMEKPFVIGDWVQTPSVEGIVEDISFRSTRFRTTPQALVTVPNSTLANEPITNWSKMGKRQITFNLAIDYAGPRDKIEKCLEIIRSMLSAHPDVHPQTILVCLDNINVNSLDILINFFTSTTNYEQYHKVKEDINFGILDILAGENLSLAAPGRIIYSEKPVPAKQVISE